MKRKKMTRILDRIALILFFFSAACLVFGYGVIVGRYQIFPFHILANIQDAVLVNIRSYQDPQLRHRYLMPAYYDYSGVRINDSNSIMKGVTLLTSHWSSLDWKPGIQLIDSTGQVLHMWKADPAEIWPSSPHTDRFKGRLNTSDNCVQGCFLFDNGDIVFNINYMGLVRMNARGEILWKLHYRTHHSVSRDQDGNFWVCGSKWIEDTPEGRERLTHYPGLNIPVEEDFALKVSEGGEILREISILKVLYQNDYEQLIRQVSKKRNDDILHTNKVEALHSDIADQYPLFHAGDIVISCKYLNAVFVIDIETEEIKWLYSGFLQQHDPNFLKDGWICVFDNNADESGGDQYPGGSRIVAVKPGENEIRMLYPKSNIQEFYTPYLGKVQSLANGNLLITEGCRGRIFETDPSGKIVWEWIHERYNNELIPEVQEGTRYALTQEQIASWKSK